MTISSFCLDIHLLERYVCIAFLGRNKTRRHLYAIRP